MIRGNILIADDNRNVLTALDLLLSGEFSSVKCLSNPNLIISELQKASYDAVLLDMNFKAGQKTGNEGLFWLREILTLDKEISVVMITAYGEVDLAVKALKGGAVDFVLKPWDNQKLLATMKAAVSLSLSRREVLHLRKDKQNLATELKGSPVKILGLSPVMKQMQKTIRKVASTPANVLITGENGTGKDLVARTIHQLSQRSEEIMVRLDLGSLSDSLFESELFGHVKGAFTGASVDRCGKIEAAHKGTLFLDEIGNLPMPMQSKLLSVLQNRSLSRLGDNRLIPVDIRLICASNTDPAQMVTEGKFRMDLLYRINTIHLEVPPLRERGNDILLLAGYFLDKYASRYKKPDLKLSKSASSALIKWHWPGNVRELEHAMEKAIILSEGNQLTADDFRFNNNSLSGNYSFDGSLEEAETLLITHSIRKHGGNLSAVAAQLGISRQTLYNKIDRYGIQTL